MASFWEGMTSGYKTGTRIGQVNRERKDKKEREQLLDTRYDESTAYDKKRDTEGDTERKEQRTYRRSRNTKSDKRAADAVKYKKGRDKIGDARNKKVGKRADAAEGRAAKTFKRRVDKEDTLDRDTEMANDLFYRSSEMGKGNLKPFRDRVMKEDNVEGVMDDPETGGMRVQYKSEDGGKTPGRQESYSPNDIYKIAVDRLNPKARGIYEERMATKRESQQKAYGKAQDQTNKQIKNMMSKVPVYKDQYGEDGATVVGRLPVEGEFTEAIVHPKTGEPLDDDQMIELYHAMTQKNLGAPQRGRRIGAY